MILVRYNEKKYLCTREPQNETDKGEWYYRYNNEWVRVVNYIILYNLNNLANVPPLQQEVELCELCGDIETECNCNL